MENKHQYDNNSFMSRTNRQFYSRKKKQPNTKYLPQMEKALKILIRRSGIQERHHRQNLKTQKNQTSQQEYSKVQELQAVKKNLYNFLEDYNPQWMLLAKKFDRVLQSVTIRKLQQCQISFYEHLQELVTFYSQKKQKVYSKQKNLQKKSSQKDNNHLVVLENIKLEKQNRMLRNQILKYDKQSAYGNNIKESFNEENIQQQINRSVALERKLNTQIQENQILAKELEYIRDQMSMMRDEKKNLQDRITEFKIKNENLCSEIISLQLKNNSSGLTREKNEIIMLMQKQEIESYQREVQDQKRLYVNLSRKYHNLINKFKKVKTDNNCKIAFLYNRQCQLFPEQLQAFEEVKNRGKAFQLKICDNKNTGKFSPLKEKRCSKLIRYQQFLGPKESINNQEGIKKLAEINYNYYLPSFYHFIADDISYYGIDQNNYETFNQKIKLNFLGTLRAIMDSKYNEMIAYEDYRLVSSFPTFVYSWLHTFHLDNNKKIIASQNSTAMPCREILSTFYVNLMSQKLNSSWQIITFRQFLLQTLRVDELYYYLGLRFYVLEGDMASSLDYCFQEIYYIDYSKGLLLIHHFIKDQDHQYLKILQEFLKRAIIYNRKKGFLDLHFLLRIMLEYYQYKKQCEIEKFIKTVDIITQNKRSNINLTEFLKIFEYHFQYLSYTQKIQLYRRCFCIGKGNISYQILISVINSEHIFVNWVDKIFLNEPIKTEQKVIADSQTIKITPNYPFLYEIQDKFQFIHNTQLKRQSYHMGIQILYKQICENRKLTHFSLHDRLQSCFKVCMLISKKYYRSNRINIEQAAQSIQLITDFLNEFSKKTMRKKQIHELMQSFKYQEACRKIVKFYQNKKKQMTRSIMYAYSNNGLKQQQAQKNETLRTQFINIIAEMKNKNKQSEHKLID